MDVSVRDWLKAQIDKEPYWFQRIELQPGIITPGWSDPAVEKLPFFGLPSDMTGMRVLDIGCSEGFFSFEAERRGAKEVIAIDAAAESIRRFNICRAALSSKADAYLMGVYDLNPRILGTFDIVMFFGVLYHLRHPLLALEKIRTVSVGKLLFQSASLEDFEDEVQRDMSMAKFYRAGIQSGKAEKPLFDRSVFWVPNAACIRDMLLHVGFTDVEQISHEAGAVFRANVPNPSVGAIPNFETVPWG